MEYIKPVYEIDVDKQEVKNYIENNIEDTEEFEKFLKEVERDIKFKLTNKDSELKKDIDDLLKDDFVYIKNMDMYYNSKFNVLIENLKKYNPKSKTISNFKFGNNNPRLTNKEEIKYFAKNEYFRKNVFFKYIDFENIKTCSLIENMGIYETFVEGMELKESKDFELIFKFLENGIIPKGLNKEEELIYLEVMDMIEEFDIDMETIEDFIYKFSTNKQIFGSKNIELIDTSKDVSNKGRVYFNRDLDMIITISYNGKTYQNDFELRTKLNDREKNYFKNNIEENIDLFADNILIPVHDLKKAGIPFMKLIVNNLIPKGLSPIMEKIYTELLNLYNKKIITYDKTLNINMTLLMPLLQNGLEYIKSNKEILSIKKLKEKLLVSENIKIDLSGIKSRYLNCEKIRADIEPYDEKILVDPNRGHWDLWEDTESEGIKQKLKTPILARNPILDIKEDGVIGIDFGTKSTVVVFQENKENTMPLRVGMGNYRKEVSKEQYENPTVMQFINIEKFLKDYDKKIGRPDTRWEDLTISHTAKNNFINSSSDKYYSFLSDLKQWAGDSKRQLRIIDKNGIDMTLKPYMELSDGDFDPIEIYAYYLGLYINNMRNGIYLDYILSFPVTYEMNIREKIVESFKKGIKKSLPITVLQDDDIIDNFSVEAGVSEPAAYAICALTEYGFDPAEDENVFYGIFDFGGGTTDFDFGLFRGAKGREQRRFDYVIEHFGASGDKYLGGENLLELLAFEVFKENESLMRKEEITFSKPSECDKFPGCEILISDSQEANLNTKQLVEKLRPLWENTEEKSDLESGIIQVELFDKNGKKKPGIELKINTTKLIQILNDRIEIGVINFFNALKLSFKNNTEKVSDVKIFLAGNSSKSDIVRELFEKYIQDENKSIKEELKCESDEFFTIYPPLGSDEACTIQEKLGLKVDENDLKRPTGKTGVAFGLVKGRKGGNIKVIDKNIVDNEINFKYYLGHNKKGKFKMEIDREVGLGKWVEFIDAYEDRFEIYYTSQPKATANNMDIKDTMRKKCKISVTSEDEDVNVFIRFVSPSKIECVVANRNDINEGNYISDIVVEELE